MRQQRNLPNYTVADYQQWEGDWELIDGIPYAMSPSPIRDHQRIVLKIVTQAENWFMKKGDSCGCEVVQDLDWIVNDSTVLRPDIAITCNDSGNYITHPPVLVFEVLSPSTASKDRFLKMEIYEEYGVGYYIIIDPLTKSYVVNELINGQYRQRKNDNTFSLTDTCIIEIDVDAAIKEVLG